MLPTWLPMHICSASSHTRDREQHYTRCCSLTGLFWGHTTAVYSTPYITLAQLVFAFCFISSLTLYTYQALPSHKSQCRTVEYTWLGAITIWQLVPCWQHSGLISRLGTGKFHQKLQSSGNTRTPCQKSFNQDQLTGIVTAVCIAILDNKN